MLNARLRFLTVLPGHLLALQCSGGDRYGFNKFSLRRVLKFKIQAFQNSPALCHRAAKFEIEFRLAAVAFEIIEDDDKPFVRPGIQIREERHHTGPVDEVTATGNVIREYGLDRIALGVRVLPATVLLAVEPRSVSGLLLPRNSTV